MDGTKFTRKKKEKKLLICIFLYIIFAISLLAFLRCTLCISIRMEVRSFYFKTSVNFIIIFPLTSSFQRSTIENRARDISTSELNFLASPKKEKEKEKKSVVCATGSVSCVHATTNRAFGKQITAARVR